MPHHLAIRVAKPVHGDPFRDPGIGTHAAKVMSEAVKPAIHKASFVLELFWKTLCERSDDLADKRVANGVGFQPTATWSVKDVLVDPGE